MFSFLYGLLYRMVSFIRPFVRPVPAYSVSPELTLVGRWLIIGERSLQQRWILILWVGFSQHSCRLHQKVVRLSEVRIGRVVVAMNARNFTIRCSRGPYIVTAIPLQTPFLIFFHLGVLTDVLVLIIKLGLNRAC